MRESDIELLVWKFSHVPAQVELVVEFRSRNFGRDVTAALASQAAQRVAMDRSVTQANIQKRTLFRL